jgi:hypothetical protein
VNEHEYEPVRGLPGLLPHGEKLLWQGTPDWRSLARRAFLGGPVAAYFAAITIWRFVDHIANGVALREATIHALWLALVGAVALGVIALMAWATAKSTVYTLTTRRLVIRSGVALTLSVNVPFRKVAGAEMRPLSGGHGDISLKLGGCDRFSYLMLWPNVRPWRISNPEPTLRALPNAAEVAAQLTEALRRYEAEHGMDFAASAASDASPAPRPTRAPAQSAIPAE